MQKKNILKAVFISVAIIVVTGWTLGSTYLVTAKGLNVFPAAKNQVQVIVHGGGDLNLNNETLSQPPLGNATGLPKWSTVFSLFLFTWPVEIVVCFLTDVFLGNALGLDKKRMNARRFGLIMGSSVALGAVSAIVHYLMVWPSIRDIPIHTTFYENELNETVPLFDFPTNFSFAANVTLLIFAALIIVGIHFLAIKYIQRNNNITSILSMILPAVYLPILWNSLARQTDLDSFVDKFSSNMLSFLLIAAFFIIGVIVLLLWQLSLAGATPLADEELARQKQREKQLQERAAEEQASSKEQKDSKEPTKKES